MSNINSKRVRHYKCNNISVTLAVTPLWEEIVAIPPATDPLNYKKFNDKLLITPLGVAYLFYYDHDADALNVKVSTDKGATWDTDIVCAGVDLTYGKDFEVYMDETGTIHLIIKPETSNIFVTDTEPTNPVLNDVWIDIG